MQIIIILPCNGTPFVQAIIIIFLIVMSLSCQMRMQNITCPNFHLLIILLALSLFYFLSFELFSLVFIFLLMLINEILVLAINCWWKFQQDKKDKIFPLPLYLQKHTHTILFFVIKPSLQILFLAKESCKILGFQTLLLCSGKVTYNL